MSIPAAEVPKDFLARTFLDEALNDAYKAGEAAASGVIFSDEEQPMATDDIFDCLMEMMGVST